MKEPTANIVKGSSLMAFWNAHKGPTAITIFLSRKYGKWRLINNVQPLNGIIIQDSGMSRSVDELSEDFASYPITLAVDYYSGYDQISLNKRSGDLTVFLADVGLVRNTRLSQGWINSVAHFRV